MTQGPLILGATGLVGRALRAVPAENWGTPPIWQSRIARAGFLQWDILNQPAPDVDCSGIVMLAGSADSAQEVHRDLAMRAAALGKSLGVRTLIASTQAVYGPQSGRLDEATVCHPVGAYGTGKLMMENAVAGQGGVTCLRIGNVIGADMLGRAAAAGPVTLDRLHDGTAPRRAMIGPVTMAKALLALLNYPKALPQTLNFAQPGLVGMDEILQAAGLPWEWTPAPDTVLPKVELDTSLLTSLIDIAPAQPAALVAEARSTGWLA